jgi:protein pelota
MTIVKKDWPRHLLDRLFRASKTEKTMIIIAIDDEGFAMAETKQYGVDVKVEDRIKLPGKLEADKRLASIKDYFKRVVASLQQLWSPNKNPIVIVGVGFIKRDFVKFLSDEAKDVAKSVVDVKSVNNGGVSGIYEALRSGVLTKAMKRMRVFNEIEVMEEIMKRLGKGEANVTYGLDTVKSAISMGAVEKLVVADTMLREADDDQRLHLEKIMREVEQRRGSITVVSTEHEAGEKLLALTGIAALLRFPIY